MPISRNGDKNGKKNGRKTFTNLLDSQGGHTDWRELKPTHLLTNRAYSDEAEDQTTDQPTTKRRTPDPNMHRFCANAAAFSRLRSEFQISDGSLQSIIMEVGDNPDDIRKYLTKRASLAKQ